MTHVSRNGVWNNAWAAGYHRMPVGGLDASLESKFRDKPDCSSAFELGKKIGVEKVWELQNDSITEVTQVRTKRKDSFRIWKATLMCS